MPSKSIWRLLIVIAIALTLSATADAQIGAFSGRIGPSPGPIIAGIVAAIAVVVIVAVVVVHKGSEKRTVTGCVKSGADGMTVIDDGDKRIYALSGNTAGINPGERLRLQGRKIKNGKTLEWETRRVSADLGVCQP
jgi:hypothetical protein